MVEVEVPNSAEETNSATAMVHRDSVMVGQNLAAEVQAVADLADQGVLVTKRNSLAAKICVAQTGIPCHCSLSTKIFTIHILQY